METGRTLALFVGILMTHLCYANDDTGAIQPPVESEQSTSDSPVSEPKTLGNKQFPKLEIHWECGGCEENEKVAPLIEQSYSEYAAAHGFEISDAEIAQMDIIVFRQRNPAARATLGIMAGKDALTTQIIFRNKHFVAKDYSANAWFGMNSLCKSVGEQAGKQIVGLLK